MTFESARPGDAAAILRIFKATFEPHLLPCVPFGASGAEHYLEDIFRFSPANSELQFVVAREGENVCGFTFVRVSPNSLFLNFIHVDPAQQGKKIGSELLAKSIELFAVGCDEAISLDVAQQNSAAKKWYERLGFTRKHTTIWKTFPLQSSPLRPRFILSGFPNCTLAHERYGFSMLTIQTLFGPIEVGRLGDKYFRSTEKRDLDRLGILHAIDPNRELLLITPEETPGGFEVSRRDRLTAKTQTVLQNLRSQ